MKAENFETEVAVCMSDLFGEVDYVNGVYRIITDEMGVTKNRAIVECQFENGLRDDAPYPVMHFHVTLTDHVPARVEPYLRTGLDELNNAIARGEFPSLGSFGYHSPSGQVYFTYRLPYNMDMLDEEMYNVKYFLGCLYEQLDLFIDYIFFLVSRPGGMSLKDYLAYLDEVADAAEMELDPS